MRKNDRIFGHGLLRMLFAAMLLLIMVPASASAEADADAEAATGASDGDLVVGSFDGSAGTASSPDDGEGEVQGASDAGGVPSLASAAGERVDGDVAPTMLIAQAESLRSSHFLAQTLENTRTVSIVSAKLPLDTGARDKAEGSAKEDESDRESDGPAPKAPAVSEESTVKGSFTHEGMTFALEEGGESVVLVAVDYNRLPESFVQQQVIVVPSSVSVDDAHSYSVTRIAKGAFAGLFESTANPDYVGCEMLFGNDELLREAGISQVEAQRFLPSMEFIGIEGDDHDHAAVADMIDIDGDGEMDTVANPLKGRAGILALGIPASVSAIDDDAFTDFGTLQCIVVSDDNPTYASYDGALYSADLTNLRLIPEGRVGAVWVAPRVATVEPEAFSHCPSVDAVVTDPAGLLALETDSDRVRNIVGPHSGSEGLVAELTALLRLAVSPHSDSEPNDMLSRSKRAEFYVIGNYNFKINLLVHGCNATYPTHSVIVTTTDGCVGYGTSGGRSGPALHFYGTAGGDSRETGRWGIYCSGACSSGGSWQYSTSPTGPWTSMPMIYADSGHGTNISSKLSMTSTTSIYFKCAHLSNWNHDVTFFPNGGRFSDNSSASQTLHGVTSTGTLPTVTREGWKFDGWYKNNDVSSPGAKITDDTAVTANTSYYARWKMDVAFNTCGQGTNSTASGYSMSSSEAMVTLPTTKPSRNGWEFQGWYDASTAGTRRGAPTAATAALSDTYDGTRDGNVTLYARFMASITWSNNSGSYSGPSRTTAIYNSNASFSVTIAVPKKADNTMTRTGYVFNGWTARIIRTSATSTIAATVDTYSVKETCSLTANWTALTCTVGFNANNGSGGQTASVTATYGSAMPAISTTQPTRNGYTFGGWYDTYAATGGTQYYTASGASNKNWDKTAATVLYARWTGNAITLSWNGNGGSAVANTTQTFSDTAKVVLPSAPTRTGYAFKGWFTSATSTTQVTASTALPSSKTTYYAHWTAHTYSVTLNTNGSGATVSPASVAGTYDQNITLPAPARTGYSFAGWNTSASGSGTKYNAGTNKNLTAAASGRVNLYAQWTLLSYTVTINLGRPPKTPAMSGGTPSWTAGVDGKVRATYDVEMKQVVLPSFSIAGYEATITGPGITAPVASFSFSPGTEGFARNLEYALTWTERDLFIEFTGVEHVAKDGSPLPRSVGLSAEQVTDGNAYAIGELTRDEVQGSYGVYDVRRYATFVGWKLARADAAGKLVYLDGTGDAPKKTLSIAIDAFGDKAMLYAEAVFEMREWTVLFDPGSGDETQIASVSTVYGASEPIAAPAPVVRGKGDVFVRWGIAADSVSGWACGRALTMEDIFKAGYPDEAIEGDTVRLHAVWIPCLSVDVPLHARIAIDAETG